MPITWAQRLKRVFGIDIETCRACGGADRIAAPAHPCGRGISASLHLIACSNAPVVVEKILALLDNQDASTAAPRLPFCRAPPRTSLVD
jgi:hypothetical protein